MPNRIVVIEDEPLIALDIEAAVTDAGCEVAGTARTILEALSLLDDVECDGAVLDANLSGESARSIVERLALKGLPYIVVSGYSRNQLDFLDESTILIGKPFDFHELIHSVRDVLGN